MKTKQTFDEYLRKGNLSENTITSYLWTVNYFTEHYDTVNKENLLAWIKKWFIRIRLDIDMLKTFLKNITILHCLPTLWVTKALKQHEYTFAVLQANSRLLLIKL